MGTWASAQGLHAGRSGAGCPGGGPDVRGARCPGLRAGCPGSKSEDELEELDFGAKIDDFGGKI